MFSTVYPLILREEGGYVNDPADSGGATNRGVTQENYDRFRDSMNHARRPVRYLTLAETETIYEKYWKDCNADQMPTGINIMHFDFAVNAGIRRAAITLQRCLGVQDDGVIGPKTLAAVAEKNGESLIKAYAESRRGFYRSLAERRPKDRKFLNGWLLRTNRVEKKSIDAYRGSTPDSGLRSV
jgi:lysozyme family protein